MAVLAPSAQAAPREEVAEAGNVRATVSYDCTGRDRVSTCKDFSVRIARAGTELVNERIRPRPQEGIARGRPAGTDIVTVVDLNGDGEQEVVVDLYTGGAHCCFYT